jgi:O-antigen ligase
MASSDGALPAAQPMAERVPPEAAEASVGASAVSGDRIALAIALTLPWWLPVLAATVPTFYKEWLFALALGFAGLLAKPAQSPASVGRPEPFVLAALAAIAILLVQAVVDGVARRATLMIFCAALFIFAIVLGRAMRAQRSDSLEWIAKCLLVAALGSCVLAAAQLFVPGLPLVLPRSGGRLFANVAQANHFCDLLWLGSISAVWLHARGILGRNTAVALLAAMQLVATTSGSRMAWIYALGVGLVGAACWLRVRAPEGRRLATGLIVLCVVAVAAAAFVAATGVLESFGLTSAEQRAGGGDSSGSDAQRLWFWRVGALAAVDHPLLGVGAGRFAGEGLSAAMRLEHAPPAAADSQAHNIFVQLAAECGIPLALVAAAALVLWLRRAWRAAPEEPAALAAVAMALPILVHANLEHPLGYLYFLGLLGLLVGQVPADRQTKPSTVARSHASVPEALRCGAFALLAACAVGYVQFALVERATQLVVAQMRAGAPPQPTRELQARLDAVPRWSAFGDYAELLALISAVPSGADAVELANRCERAAAIGPSPQLLARCATILQIAGAPARATYFANALCKVYPGDVPTLIESMTFLSRTSTAVDGLRSTCVQRAD